MKGLRAHDSPYAVLSLVVQVMNNALAVTDFCFYGNISELQHRLVPNFDHCKSRGTVAQTHGISIQSNQYV